MRFFFAIAILAFVLAGCFAGGLRHKGRVVQYEEPDTPERGWFVRLRNAQTRQQRTFVVSAPSQARAIDSALARARREGWGNAPLNLVWVKRQGE